MNGVDLVYAGMVSVFFQQSVCSEPKMTYDYDLRMTVVNGQSSCKLPVRLRAAIDTAMIQYDMEKRARQFDKDQKKYKEGP